jgi:hypothetical protein
MGGAIQLGGLTDCVCVKAPCDCSGVSPTAPASGETPSSAADWLRFIGAGQAARDASILGAGSVRYLAYGVALLMLIVLFWRAKAE